MWDPRPGQRALAVRAAQPRVHRRRVRGRRPGRPDSALKDTSSNDVLVADLSAALGRRATIADLVAAYYRYGDDLDVDGSVENDSLRANAPTASFGRARDIVFTRSLTVRDLSMRAANSPPRWPPPDAGRRLRRRTRCRTTWGWRISGDRNDTEANGSSVLGGAGLPDLLDSHADIGAGRAPGSKTTSGCRRGSASRAACASTGMDPTAETLASPRARVDVRRHAAHALRLAARALHAKPRLREAPPGRLLRGPVEHARTRAQERAHRRTYIGGLEHDFGRGVSARVEGYYKSFDD